jgi:hypothetical protein
MKALLCVTLLVALCAACIAAESVGSPLDRIRADGWYGWRVEAVAGLQCRCCSGGHGGACDLDSGGGSAIGSDDGPTAPDTLRIYAQMQSGRPVRLRAVGPGCRVTTGSPVTDLGIVDADSSITWLARFIEPRNALSSDLMEAVQAHANERSVAVLTGIVRSGHDIENRKEALFWLAQSDSEPAFDFIDGLLSQEP